MSSTKSRHGGDIYGFSDEERDKFLDFSININPLGLSPKGKAALTAGWEKETLRYTDVKCRDLIKALSERYHVNETNIVVGNGATELMYAILRIINPDLVLIPAPSFSEYRLSAEAAGAKVLSLMSEPAASFKAFMEEVKNNIQQNSLIYVGNPNNPDGLLLDSRDLSDLIEIADAASSFLVIDESFIDFVGDEYSYSNLSETHSNVIIVTSLTKFYAVPGLRIGCAFLPQAIRDQVNQNLVPWNVNGLAQLYMVHAVKDNEYIEESISFCLMQRAKLVERLKEFPEIKVYPGTVNFVLCELLVKGMDAKALQAKLIHYGIIIRKCGNYEGLDDSFFRVAVRSDIENNKLINALHEVLAK